MKPAEAKRLAKMLLGLTGMDKAANVLSELHSVEAALGGSREFRIFLSNPQFTDSEREGAIKELGKNRLSGETVKFLTHLASMKGMKALGKIIRYAEAVYRERRNLAVATVVTPKAVGTEYESRLKGSLKKITGREIEIKYEIDPSLIGGVLIQVGSMMFDGSIKGQLRLLKEDLVKG